MNSTATGNLYKCPSFPISARAATPVVAVLRVAARRAALQDVAATLVREVAKLEKGKKPRVDIDPGYDGAFRVEIPGENDDKPFWITAKNVRLSDTSARVKGSDESPDRLLNGTPIPEDITPLEMSVIGNYAMSVSWPDGLSQVAAFSTLAKLGLPGRAVSAPRAFHRARALRARTAISIDKHLFIHSKHRVHARVSTRALSPNRPAPAGRLEPPQTPARGPPNARATARRRRTSFVERATTRTSTSSATASARETLERFFSRWRTVADVKRARRTLARRALLEWRRVVERDVRARRCLAGRFKASLDDGRTRSRRGGGAASRRRRRRAFMRRWRRRRANDVHLVVSSGAIERARERARAEAHELRSLGELRLARANAERDAAVERRR